MNSGHHYLWIFFAFAVLGMVTYFITLNRPDQYEKGSIHAEQHEQNWPLSISIGKGGCATLGKGQNVKTTPTINGSKLK